jgi:hypothetical protein
VTKGDYPYPADEFDTVERGAVPRGVHRATRSVWKRVWPFLLVIVLFPALAYGAVTYWSSERSSVPTATGSSTGGVVVEETPAATPAETPVETPAPVVDLATPVVVFNATSTSGLAGTAAGLLTDAGWVTVTSDNYTGTAVDTSIVQYGTADLEVSAQAAADALGITAITLDPSVDGIAVVLAADYTP